MNKKGNMSALISEGLIAIVGLFILFNVTKSLCEADGGFCFYGWRIFGIIFISVYFIIKYGFGGR